MLADFQICISVPLSKNQNSKGSNKLGATNEHLLLEELHGIMTRQPDNVFIHASTNDLTNGINIRNNTKKIVKEL